MKVKIIYSPSNNPKEAHQEISRKIEDVDFKPKFLFLFLTAGTWKAYKSFNELLKRRFPDTKMLGCIVEGYIADDSIWMRGVAVLLADFDSEVEVFWAREKSATKTIEKLGDKIGRGWDAILLMFPAFYFPSKFEFLRYFFNDKRYYRSFVKNKHNEEGEKALKLYSKYLNDKKMSYPINTTIKVISKKTGRNTPIVGLVLLPLEASSYTPLILSNYKNVENGAAAMCFKGEVNTVFHDVFPQRGDNYEETFKIIKEYFPMTEKVKTIKGGIAIGEIDGLKPMDFLKTKRCGIKDVTQDDFIKNVEDGKQLMASPYLTGFISKRTHGTIFLALINSPLSIYPTAFNVDYFYDTAAFVGEVFRGGIRTFGGIFDLKKFEGFDFLIIDCDTIMSFGGEVHKLIKVLTKSPSKSLF